MKNLVLFLALLMVAATNQPPGVPDPSTAKSLFAPLALPAPTASATLAWDASVSPEVVGYFLYTGNASRVYNNTRDVGNVLSVAVTNLAYGTTYWFTVTAYDAYGVESPYSNEVSYSPVQKTNRMVQIQPLTGPTLTGPWATNAAWPAVQVLNPSTNLFYKFALTNWYQ